MLVSHNIEQSDVSHDVHMEKKHFILQSCSINTCIVLIILNWVINVNL